MPQIHILGYMKNVEQKKVSREMTSGERALKGGIPVINSNKMIPTDHQSAA